MTKRDRTLDLLRSSRSQGAGWVTGRELQFGGGGARYGARIHELRAAGHKVQCDTSRRDQYGDVVPRYRLILDIERDKAQGELFGEAA